MKSEQANGQRQFQWWLLVAALALATAACNGKKEEPKGADTTKSTAKSEQQQPVMLEPCGDCCSLASGAQPKITSFAPQTAGNNSFSITVTTTGADQLPCTPAEKLPLGVGHYLAVILDDNPEMNTSYDQRYIGQPYLGPLTTGAPPKVARGYLAFNPAAGYSVCMKYPNAAVAYSYNDKTEKWTEDKKTPMVILNLPEAKPAGPYPSANVPLDFVLNNAPLDAGFKLHVTIPGKLNTVITQNKPFRIKNLAAGEYTVTVQLQELQAGEWKDVKGGFTKSSRTFKVK